MPLPDSEFPLFKLSATGNDFLLVDLLNPNSLALWKREWGTHSRSALVREWCNRHEGLGADGVLFIEPDPSADFVWDFYNSDGGSAELCGNAARAVSLYMQREHGKAKLSFKTRAGFVNARVESAESIEVELPAIAFAEWDQLTSNQKTLFDFVMAGVPHAVVQVPSLKDRAALQNLALALKSELRFQKDGVNVTFVQTVSPSELNAMTFERGVEDFTLACGTGAVAAAHWVLRGKENQEIQVQVPGGRLSVIWKSGRPLLKGPAKVVAKIYLLRA